MKEYIKQQIEWFKGFFMSDNTPNAPSHKNLISIGIVIVFCIAFLKKLVGSAEIPDVPAGWQLVLLVVLGIRSAQSVAEKLVDKKFTQSENGEK